MKNTHANIHTFPETRKRFSNFFTLSIKKTVYPLSYTIFLPNMKK